MLSVFFATFGCKVNQYETECLREVFRREGFNTVGKASDADVIVVNTCSVTASADSKSLYAVRKFRRSFPNAVIAVCGCIPQTVPNLSERLPEADILSGTRQRAELPQLVNRFIAEKRPVSSICAYEGATPFEELPCGSCGDKTRAFVKIQDGCDRFCSYCIIPYSRGRCRSKPLEAIRREVSSLAEAGRKEIVLVGINLAFYGEEFGLRLIDAVETCCAAEGIERVRLGSLEPEMISDDDLKRLAVQPKFCPQFHLSLQSGCDRTLHSMNRHYNCDQYLGLVNAIRSYFPDCAITTDMMVGFPTETEDDFEESLAFAERVGFAKIHVFQYSPRHGTPAAKLPQLPDRIKAMRADRLKALGTILEKQHIRNMIGKTVPVLFEREKDPDHHHGYAPDHTLVKVKRKNLKKSLRYSIFYVKIEESGSDHCIGSVTHSAENVR